MKEGGRVGGKTEKGRKDGGMREERKFGRINSDQDSTWKY